MHGNACLKHCRCVAIWPVADKYCWNEETKMLLIATSKWNAGLNCSLTNNS